MTYGLITPAKNEEEFIGLTIDTVVNQTVRPVKWIIVSDGSDDNTDSIVESKAAEHPWIELLSLPHRKTRDFGGKARAFMAGYDRIKGHKLDLVGNLDADISLDNEHYEFLLQKFAANPKLGIAGSPFLQGDSSYNFQFSSLEHVSGACQLFRKQCFEDIGGYKPLERGGIDVVAVLSARMNQWETRTFVDKPCRHHRIMGTAGSGKYMASFRLGEKDYILGRHPLWQFLRSFYQMGRKPYFIIGFNILSGYVWAAVSRKNRPISKDLIRFQRNEQMRRLRMMMPKWFWKKPDVSH